MLLEALMCESSTLATTITAAVNILGGIGADYALGSACASSPAISYLHLHGMKDPSISYNAAILVDGVRFLSAVAETQLRAQRSGCLSADAGPQMSKGAGAMLCKDYCAKAVGRPTTEICGIVNAGHDTNHPYTGVKLLLRDTTGYPSCC